MMRVNGEHGVTESMAISNEEEESDSENIRSRSG
jgi:hypothetical protein